MSSNLKVNTILPSTGTTVAVSGIASVTSSVSIASSCTATTFYGSGANLTNLPTQVTITGNANDRIFTGGGGTNLIGESGLTFNGNNLAINASSDDGRVSIVGHEGYDARLSLIADQGDDHIDQWNIRSKASNNTLTIDQFGGGTFNTRLTIASDADDGNVTLNTGNLVIGTAGKGIDFSATSSNGSGELLDDYEYGSWTPTISAHLGGGSFTTNAAGRYVKVGRLVSLWGYLSWTAKGGSGVVNLNATGLPFATHNTAPNNSSVCIGSRSGWNQLRLVGQMYQTGYINVQYINSSGNSVNVNVSSLDNSGSIYYRFQYESAS